MLPRVAVIVLAYNQIDLTLECLGSLLAQDYPNAEIIVVDNNSQDDTPRLVHERYPQAIVIENQSNLGYARGNNVGIQFALERGADYVFLVNNDTWLQPNCLSSLMDTMKAQPRIGAAGPKVFTDCGFEILSSAGGWVDWRHVTAINVGAGERDLGQYGARPVDFVNGCGILVAKSAIEKAGLIDAEFFMYWEETDWCLRMREKGFIIYYEPKAAMVHKAPILSESLSPTTLYYMTRNRFLFFYRHTPGRQKPITFLRMLKGALRGVVQNRLDGRKEHSRAMAWATVHALAGKWGYRDPSLWMKRAAT